jgi:hypothetical protein
MPDDAVLRMVARLVDETSAPLKQMQRQFADFQKQADPEKTTAHFKGMSGAVKGFGESITEFAQPALASFGIASGLTAASVIGLTKAVSDYANGVSDLKDTAAVLNMSASSATNWDRALRSVGVEGGLKNFKGIADDMLEIGQQVDGVREKWENAGLGDVFAKAFSASKAGDAEKYLSVLLDKLRQLQNVNPALASRFARDWLHTSAPVPQLLEAEDRKRAMADDPDAAAKFAQAERLKATMADFWTSWDKFYSSAMEKLIPGINDMMKGMTAGFEKLPEIADRFLNSPVGKLLAAMLPKEDTTVDKEGNLKPPPELGPALSDPVAEREAQKKRNAAGGAIPSLIRAGQEMIDLATTGQVKRRTATHEIDVPIDKWIGKAFQGPATNEAGGAADPFGREAWSSYGETEAGKEPPAITRVPTGAQPIIIPPTPPAPAADPFKFNPASGNVEYTEPPATGDDVKDGAKQGIIEGLGEWFSRNVLSAEGRKDLGFKDPTADVKRSNEDIKAAADRVVQPGDEVGDPFGSLKDAAESYSKPGLEQDTKTGEAARRLQQGTVEQLSNIKPPADETMRMIDAAINNQKQDDDTLRNVLVQQPQLMPSADQLTEALSNQKVEGAATLKVDIAAPPGTKTAVGFHGLFKQSEVRRRRAFQMEKTAFNDGFDN